MTAAIESPLSELGLDVLQQEVQRNLGRCMLRLQQYERQLKVIVASRALEGPIEQLQSLRAQKFLDTRGKTLGALVRMFTGAHLISTNSEDAAREPSGADAGAPSDDVAFASIRFNITMSPERYAQTTAGLVELVALRNDLVHHLIERFDISDKSGCTGATEYLKGCYEKIDNHCQLLMGWAKGLANTQAISMSVLQSTVFEDMFVHGINPDGSVSWERSSIVECLRAAEAAYQVNGWTPLDEAIAHIARTAPGQMPRKYGCKTWRQVLRLSQLFEYQSVRGEEGRRGHARYRSGLINPWV